MEAAEVGEKNNCRAMFGQRQLEPRAYIWALTTCPEQTHAGGGMTPDQVATRWRGRE